MTRDEFFGKLNRLHACRSGYFRAQNIPGTPEDIWNGADASDLIWLCSGLGLWWACESERLELLDVYQEYSLALRWRTADLQNRLSVLDAVGHSALWDEYDAQRVKFVHAYYVLLARLVRGTVSWRTVEEALNKI